MSEVVRLYESLSNILLVVSVISIGGSVLLFFLYRIPSVIGYLSGYSEKKAIERAKERHNMEEEAIQNKYFCPVNLELNFDANIGSIANQSKGDEEKHKKGLIKRYDFVQNRFSAHKSQEEEALQEPKKKWRRRVHSLNKGKKESSGYSENKMLKKFHQAQIDELENAWQEGREQAINHVKDKQDMMKYSSAKLIEGEESQGLTDHQNAVAHILKSANFDSDEGADIDTTGLLRSMDTDVLVCDETDVLLNDSTDVLLNDSTDVLYNDSTDVLAHNETEVLVRRVGQVLAKDEVDVLEGESTEVLAGRPKDKLVSGDLDVLLGDNTDMLAPNETDVLVFGSTKELIGEEIRVLDGESTDVLERKNTEDFFTNELKELTNENSDRSVLFDQQVEKFRRKKKLTSFIITREIEIIEETSEQQKKVLIMMD